MYASNKKAGGIIGCPSDAVQEVKAISDYVCLQKAGNGAFREFSEWLISEKNLNLNSRVQSAFDYLMTLTYEQLAFGRHKVDENFYYSVLGYKTKLIDECKLESHRKHVDIQIILEGEERMEIVDTSRLSISEEYVEAMDVMFWNIPDRMASIKLKEGDHIILFPENAHRGAGKTDKETYVRKIVGKVKI